jgi:hypothetical protein
MQALVVAVKIDDIETNDEKTKYSKIPLIWHTGIRQLPDCSILQIFRYTYANLT